MYTIIGNGRLAQHFVFYFTHLNIEFNQWHRGTINELENCLKNSSHVLVLLSDSVIENFLSAHHHLCKNHYLIHCSGALISEYASTAHPLMTFSHQIYELGNYLRIPFILEQEGPRFKELFPNLPNPYFYIPKNKKSYYHALCVMANNFTTILWKKFFQEMSTQFNFDVEFAEPILEQTFKNLIKDPYNALTGPFARKDLKTINTNLQALQNDQFQKIYQSFVETLINQKEISS